MGDRAVQDLLPGPAAQGAGSAYMEAFAEPLRAMDLDLFWLNQAAMDPQDACGPALDLLGDWVRETRQGLGDDEYRRIIRGRQVASVSGIVPAAVWAAWTALASENGASMVESPKEAFLRAEVYMIPTDSWRLRAGDVLRDMRPIGTYFYAVAAHTGAFQWGRSSFSSGSFSADFGV
jgi:hypothetical protein